MSVTSLQDQVASFLNKRVVAPKVGGAPSPDLETASVLESLALAFMLQPKAALYSHYLAKNGLVVSIDKEVSAIESLKLTIQDLGNVTYAIKDTKNLARAQAAALQLSLQGQLSSDSNAFERYSVAIDDFLEKQLGKNVKRPGATVMVRPGDEAKESLPSDLSTTEDAHADFLARLYALAVGIPNFLTTPFSALVGENAVYRVKKDLDEITVTLGEDDSGSQSRDVANRLIAGRATIRMTGSSVDISAPVVSTTLRLPPGRLLSGQSIATAAVATTAVGPFTMASGGSLSMTVDGQTVTTSALNQANNAAAILSAAVAYPVSVPPNYHLFLRLDAASGITWLPGVAGSTEDGTFYDANPLGLGHSWFYDQTSATYYKTIKAVLNSGSPIAPPGSTSSLSRSLSNVVTAVNLALGSLGFAAEFVGAGSNRLLISASTPSIAKIAIARSAFMMETQSNGQAGDTGATALVRRSYSNTFHESLGFTSGQVGNSGSTPASRIAAGLSIVFPSLVTSRLTTDDAIEMTTLVSSPGVAIDFTGTWVASLGLVAQYIAESTTVGLLDGSDPASPIGVVDVGDVLQSSTGSSSVSALSTSALTLSAPIRTFSGGITITSALYLVWVEATNQLQSFLSSWVEGPYASGLPTLDRLIAVLIGSPASPRRREALDLLDDLKSQLLSLRSALTTSAATLPRGSASKEKAVVNNTITTFTERKLDRAVDFLLKCQLQDIFELDWQTASYGGNLMKAAADVARQDVRFPDTTKDEGFEVGGTKALRNSNG